MASYKHGVYTSETSTSLVPTTTVLSAVPFVVGTAPVNLASEAKVNEPVLCYSYKEAASYFGFEAAKAGAGGLKRFAYSLSEFMYAAFTLYSVSPVIMVNVLDPVKHKSDAETKTLTFDPKTGKASIKETGVIASTVTIAKNEDSSAYLAGTDYVTAFDDDGYLVISSLSEDSGTFKVQTGVELKVTASKIDPSKVTSADIIGGISTATGAKTGFELVADAYPKLGVIPTMLLAPGFSKDPEVAAVMSAKALKINGLFNAMAIIDVDTAKCVKYSDVPAYKNSNSLAQENDIVCWPCVNLSGTVYSLSTHVAGVLAVTDGDRNGVPYVSPSNKSLSATGTCLAGGSEVVLGLEEANYLNGQGIVTGLNFPGAWKVWGNRTGAYPSVTDPKDAFIPVKRMFYWVADTIITTIWQKVDEPGNKRLIDSVVDSLNVWLNSLAARQQLLGGRIEFRDADNPTTDLMDGKYHFKVFITPPSPAEDLEFDLEIDTGYYSTLFD